MSTVESPSFAFFSSFQYPHTARRHVQTDASRRAQNAQPPQRTQLDNVYSHLSAGFTPDLNSCRLTHICTRRNFQSEEAHTSYVHMLCP